MRALEEACHATHSIAHRFQAAECEAGALFVGAYEGEVRSSATADQFARFSPADAQKSAQGRPFQCPSDHVALPSSMINDLREEMSEQVWSVQPPAYPAPAFGEQPPAVGCVPLGVWHSYLQKLGIMHISDQQNADYNTQISALATIALRAGGGIAIMDGPQPGPLDLAGLAIAGVILIGGLLMLSSRGSNIVYASTAELIEQIREKLENIKENELDDRTLEGARTEREGGNVGHQHPSGRDWDHVTKVRQGISGLENLRRRIEAKLRHHAQHDPAGLSREEKQELEAILQEINELLRKAKEAIGEDSPSDEGTSNDAE